MADVGTPSRGSRTVDARAPGTHARCTVHVPASTSNLGAGFDCVGVAVDRWLTIHVTIGGDAPTSIDRHGTLAALDLLPERDLIVRGFVAACEAAHVTTPRVRVEADSTIPVGRGLGSSAAACVAGALAANDLLALGFDADAIVNVAANIEGHPDNVAPAVHGGAVLGVRTDAAHNVTASGAWYVAPLRVDPSLRLAFAIPDFEIATRAARSVLPRDVEFATAVDAAARAAALIAGLASGDRSLLRSGFDDVLHVPHRRALIPGYDAVAAAAAAHGAYGATLSGSGSSLVAVAPTSRAAAVAAAMCDAWREIGVVAEALVSAGEVPGAAVTRAHS
jgi:homoserine kinase